MSKQSVVTFILVLLVTNYLSFQAGQTMRYYQGPATSRRAPAQARAVGVNQILLFTPSRVDFGTIAGNETQQRFVDFENRGLETVHIERVGTSHSCTVAELIGEAAVAPGSKGRLRIVVDPSTAPASLAISVSVEYVGTEQTDRLLVSGQAVR